MDNMSDWVKHMVEKSPQINQMDVQNVCNRIQTKELSIERVVTDLGPLLINTETNERSKGLNILTQIVISLPNDFLSITEVQHLTRFYCDRLRDHYSLISHVFSGLLSIMGCLNFDKSMSQTIFSGLVKETSVQQYPVSDRFLVFQLLTKMFHKYSEELKANRPEFLYGLLQLVEGERDPRCLLVVFRLMHSVIESLDLDPYTEDVFEVISCYFPILFTPTPDDEYGITKEDLSGELHRCFTACPQFSSFLFPLVLEKLESELITAKIDSYKVIEGVSRNYGYERINEFIPQLWTAIRVDVLKPKLLETEISEHALKALISMSDALIENELMFDSFTKQIWTDISNAFNKPELDLVDSGVSIMLATISSNAYAFNQMITQLMPILLKQFTFCQKESTRVVIIESISRILSHSRNISQKQINLINFESLFTLMTSLSVADTETDNIRGSVVSCLQQLIQLKEMNDNKWEIITKVLQSLLDNCLNGQQLLSKTYLLIESITKLNPKLIQELIQSLIDKFDSDYTTEVNQKRILCTLNAMEVASSELNCFKSITAHLVEEIKANSYYFDDNQEQYSMHLIESLSKCIEKQTKVEIEEELQSFLFNECFDRLIQHCIHVSICTDNKSGTVVNMKLMDSLFGVIGRGVSKLNIKYSQHLSESLLQFSVMGKVDELLPVLPPTCFCTYETGLKFLDSLNATQALIVFGLTNGLISNLKYQINANQLTELFDKLVIFATNNKYNNLKICLLATKSIGALVNRFDGKIDALNEKLKQFLKQTEERLDDNELSEENQLLIINALIWSTKGLVIGGHIVRKDFIALLMKLIEHNNSLIRNEVSKAFAVIQSKDESCLTSDNNANVRILYNQSFYFETFDTLLSGYLKYKSEDSDRKQIFLSALLTQLNLIPKAVFCNELKRLLPMLLDAISDHSITSDCLRDNQRAALDAIHQILIDKNERILDPSLKSTVNNCVNLSINSPYLEVRRSALNCLAEIAHNFEDSILNHLRDEVVRNLRKTLNDRKRIVRKSAVRARCKWILIGQPGK